MVYNMNEPGFQIELNALKKKLEAEGERKVKILAKTNADVQKSVIEIIQEGATEFKQKTGRNMTYSEMREMYG
jgi:hypothetical protein